MVQTGLRKSPDIHNYNLQKHKIKNSTIQLHSFIRNIRQNINPFATDLNKDCLFNISTRQAADEKITDFLLNIENNGDKQRRKFIDECSRSKQIRKYTIKKNQNFYFRRHVKKKENQYC